MPHGDGAVELARAVRGVTANVVRYYAREGLLDLKEIDAEEKLYWIVHMKRAGLSLAEVRVELPRIMSRRGEQLVHLLETLEKHSNAVFDIQVKLEAEQREIRALMDTVFTMLLDAAGEAAPDTPSQLRSTDASTVATHAGRAARDT